MQSSQDCHLFLAHGSVSYRREHLVLLSLPHAEGALACDWEVEEANGRGTFALQTQTEDAQPHFNLNTVPVFWMG